MIPDNIMIRIEMLAKYKKECESQGIDLKELLLFQISEELQLLRILEENNEKE